MSCPLNRNRWAGSGYTKPVAQSETAKEIEAKMNAMLAERSLQDTKYYPQTSELCASATGACKPVVHDPKKQR
jgi:hypothetical protein